jgi:hypothetical protein
MPCEQSDGGNDEAEDLAMAADQGGEFEQYRRATRCDVFPATMNEIVPWEASAKCRATAQTLRDLASRLLSELETPR